jgi:copper(I)-binding protein
MKRFFMILLAGIIMLSACTTAAGIEVSKAWARPATQGGNGAVYFVLHNGSADADELTGVSSEIAEVVEMHETKMEGDVMQMQQVMSIPVGAGDSVELMPGGLHIMLIGLKKDLKAGDEIEITLHFANSEDITVTAPVQEQAGNSMSAH